MARTSNNGGESKTRKAPTRRRSDRTRQAAPASANDTVSTSGHDGITLGVSSGPNATEVQRRAYELYVQRGGSHGHDKEDWYEAERQLRQQ